MEAAKVTGRIFFKGTFDLEKDIKINCPTGVMTTADFKEAVDQVRNSEMYYACNSAYTSIQKVCELCKVAGFEHEQAFEQVCKSYGRLLHYTGD